MSIVQALIGAIASSGSGGGAPPPPTPTYTLTPATTSTNEGSSLEFTVGGTNITNGTYYWTISSDYAGESDFSTINGTVSVTGNSGSFTVTPTADDTTEGSETFIVSLREGSITGTILATSTSVTITDTSLTLVAPFSLNFPAGNPYLLVSNTQSDWNLGTTYTIEFWSKATNVSTSTVRTVMSQGPSQGNIDLGFMNGNLLFNDSNPTHAEPTTGVWTHVAFVRESGSGNINIYYNGFLQTTFNAGLALTNGSSDLNIGRRLGVNGQGFLGKLAMIRISTTAKYVANFSPSTSYGVGADTKLMLGSDTPLVDSVGTHPISVQGAVTVSDDFPSYQSLVFNQPQQDYLSTPASADWNLGNNWTMEFWIKSNNNSLNGINIPGGQWGLINQGGWYGGMPDDNCILVGLAGGYLSINQSANGDISFVEPTTQVWTHVAIVNNGGGSAQKVYYNGVEQTPTGANYTTNGKTNITADLYIGRLSPQYNAGYASHFDGKLALVRISNAAKYSENFIATTTYIVEPDTKLFLSKVTPTIDAKAHAITNNGTTLSNDFPVTPTYTLTPATTSTNEGSSLEFTVGGTNITNGTYYWATNANEIDVTTRNGSFSITSNSGSFSITPNADARTDGAGTITVTLRRGSVSGTVLATSTVTINDTSLDPASITITNVSVGFNSREATVDFTATITQSETATIFFDWSGAGTFSGPHTLTVNPGSNTYTSPTLSLAGAGNDLTTEITIASGVNSCTSNIYTGSWSVICLVEGTMITMADGSYKAIEDIRYNDLIRVWNFDLGEFSEALPVFVKQEEIYAEHYRFTFSDGTVLRTVGHHVFNKQAGAFTMLVRDTTPVGTITFNELGEEVTLISKETIQESVKFYNVWTQYHLNLFAQGILTSNRFNNIYPIQDMKFVKDNRALRPLEEFADIDPKYVSGLRLQEQPAQYTAEYIRNYVENKLERLDVNLVSTQ